MADQRFETTSWSLIQAAANGRAEERETFARRYGPALSAYFAQRWKGLFQRQEHEDAVQETMLECFREGGALNRLNPEHPGGFRSFLLGVARNVALRLEEKARRRGEGQASAVDWQELDADVTSLSEAFDRAYASSLLRMAAERMAERATSDAARWRVEFLRLRFAEDQPIREIAKLSGRTAEALYQDQFRAREEFREALREVVRVHLGEGAEAIERECQRLLEVFAD